LAEFAPPENGRLADHIDAGQGPEAVTIQQAIFVSGDAMPDCATNIVDDVTPSYEPLNVRILLECLCDRRECAGAIEIVAIQPRNDVAARHRKSFIDGGGLTGIGLADPLQARVADGSQLCQSFVLACAVDDDPLQFEIADLIQNAAHGAGEIIRGVQQRGEDRERWALGGESQARMNLGRGGSRPKISRLAKNWHFNAHPQHPCKTRF
jgi:hypothetical protein